MWIVYDMERPKYSKPKLIVLKREAFTEYEKKDNSIGNF